MIKSIRSKSLAPFWSRGAGRKLPVENHDRVRRILLALDAAARPEDMNLPGYRFHGLHGNPRRWSVWVSGNFRITWAWDQGAVDVDIEDYH